MSGWVYIMASKRNGTIYIGVTSDLQGRAYEHRTAAQPGFTSRYGCNRLVWYERHDNIIKAIAREKELKKWRRSWKLHLIEGFKAEWDDLFETCYERDNPSDAIRARSDAVRQLDWDQRAGFRVPLGGPGMTKDLKKRIRERQKLCLKSRTCTPASSKTAPKSSAG